MASNVPIIIDNGSYQCRAGFANKEEPEIIFRNYAAKLRKERGKKDVEIQVGNEIENLDGVRSSLKSPFDKNVVIFMDTEETILDYIFASLNLGSEDRIDHPIVMSEAFLNPNYCRHMLTELLFECYQVPGVTYGVDALFSFKNNYPEAQDGLVVSFGQQTVHVLPYLNGKVDAGNSRRINLGGADIVAYLLKILQLKYPGYDNIISMGKSEELLHQHGNISKDYKEELLKWADPAFRDANLLKLEPLKSQVLPSASDSIKERRKDIARKMVELNAKKREEKLAEDEERLGLLLEIKELTDTDGSEHEIERALTAASVANIGELIKSITMLKMRIQKAKNRSKEKSAPIAVPTGEPETGSTEPSQQRTEWLAKIRTQRAEILKRRALRRQRRLDMVKRKTAASQERMRILSQLARQEKNDTFGMKDDDWDVYKSIQKDGGGSDSDDDKEELNDLEQTLKLHDPTFTESQGESRIDQELYLGVERTRAPEVLFQPSMLGELQTGVAETIEHVLKLYNPESQLRLVSNIFLTGGSANYRGMLPRIQKEVLEMRPFESHFAVNLAKDPSLDAWYGMRAFGLSTTSGKYFLSKAEFDDKGGEYLKEHPASNCYYPSPHMTSDTSVLDTSPLASQMSLTTVTEES